MVPPHNMGIRVVEIIYLLADVTNANEFAY